MRGFRTGRTKFALLALAVALAALAASASSASAGQRIHVCLNKASCENPGANRIEVPESVASAVTPGALDLAADVMDTCSLAGNPVTTALRNQGVQALDVCYGGGAHGSRAFNNGTTTAYVFCIDAYAANPRYTGCYLNTRLGAGPYVLIENGERPFPLP